MKTRSLSILSLFLFFAFGSIHAQFIQENMAGMTIDEDNYKHLAAILFNGKSIVDDSTEDGQLALEIGTTGRLSVSTIQRNAGEWNPIKTLQFKIAIRNHRTGALWMYSNKNYTEIEVEELLEVLEFQDEIIFITIDRSVRLPRHSLILNSGC